MEKEVTLSAQKQALLARRLRGTAQSKANADVLFTRVAGLPVPLAFIQRQMWTIDQMTPGNPAYNIPVAYRIKGNLDIPALEKSFDAIVQRHEILRSTFATHEGDPVQVIQPTFKISFFAIDLRQEPEELRETRLRELVSEEAIRPFDLSRLPLIRLALFSLGTAEHVLVITIHHIVADGLSIGLLMNELDLFYRAYTGKYDAILPALSLQYGDFAAWQNQKKDDPYAEQITFWKKQLGGALPVLAIPTDKPRPPIQSFRGSNVFFHVPRNLIQELKALAMHQNCTFFMAVLAIFQVLLRRHSSAEDVVIGTPVAMRTLKEIEPLIGNFLNMSPLRCDVSGNPSFIELLDRSRETTLNAFSNGDVPFQLMVNHLKIERDQSRNPVFQVLLQVTDVGDPKIGDLHTEAFHFDSRFAQLDLSLHLYEEAGGCVGRFEYCSDLFLAETIARLSSHFQQLLQAMVSDPHQRILDIPMLAASEKNQLVKEWNNTKFAYPMDALVQDQFEAQTVRAPQRIALKFKTAEWTFADLDARANRLAHVLRASGAARGQRVGVCVERGPDMLAAVLGILKTGAAYVPLDPLFPEERVRYMADDAEISLLVSSSGLVNHFGFALPRDRQLLLDADAAGIEQAPTNRLQVDGQRAMPNDPAYVIYTSGSTGKPKGVVLPHGAVVNFLMSMAREPGLTADDVLVAVTTLSFDIAVLELQLPLALGATIVMASRDEAIDGQALKALIERQRATVLQATPVTWRLLLEAGWAPKLPFKALVGGEALPKDLADQLIARGIELWNMYGPTETTVWSTCARITDTSNGILIGKPIANTTIRILDTQGSLCPIGVPGEMYIGGDGVAIGYWKRPDLTSERFIPDSFSEVPNARMYRTGDLARWRSDGNLEHLGRLDSQVKLRGYRIELGEIETGIAGHPAVREVVVIAREDVPGDKRLVAYVVTENAPPDLIDQLRTQIRLSMPEYMVPAHFVSIDALPLTPNGKIDRKSLPAPQFTDDAIGARDYVAPRNDLEISLTAAWEKVLGVPRVGITENFFELGGNSFSVVKLIFEMKQATGIEIDLGDVFTFPTIEKLVGQFSPDAKKEMSVVVPLQAAGEGVPLFCICGINIYRQFAQSLGNDQPVFGVYVAEEQAIVKQLAEGIRPEISIERLVDAYDRAIARFRPHGPYRLGGISFGGVLAMGLATKLRERGERVEVVLLLDTMLPRGKHRNWPKWIRRNTVDFLTGRSWSKVRQRLFGTSAEVVQQPVAEGAESAAAAVDDAYAARLGAEFFKASKQWEERDTVCDFPVVLFRATDHSEWGSDVEFDEDYGWRPYVGENLSIVHVDGNHLGIIESPNVERLGPRARQIIDAAEKRAGHS